MKSKDRKAGYLSLLKVDYHIFNEIESILNDNVSNHVKLNLISDVIKQELEKVLEDVYEEGYYWGKEDAEDNNNSLLELEELRQREICDYCLYVITPKMTGVYSIAEVIDDSNKRPKKTIFCYLNSDFNYKWLENEYLDRYIYFDEGQIKSLEKVGKMVEDNGGKFLQSLQEIADFLNSKAG